MLQTSVHFIETDGKAIGMKTMEKEKMKTIVMAEG